MKVQSLHLKHFKRFREQSFDFTDPETGLAKNLIVLVGKNGSGKTSLLQSIAAVLGNATGRLEKLSDLNWPGFDLELANSNWQQPTSIKIEVEFSPTEITATQEFYQKNNSVDSSIKPSDNRFVTLTLQNDKVHANTPEEFFQFKGRSYAKQIIKTHPFGYKLFEQVGTVFWYTEQRTATSLTDEHNGKTINISDELLRDRLSKFALFHQQLEMGKFKELRRRKKDLFVELQKAYQTVFPERCFEGTLLRPDIDDILSEPWFYFNDGRHQYEISEMSGGEKAIFPILFDFVNWNIHNSVILIDEIELHLHPPIQQAFLRALPKMGKNNQFIISTHSDYIEQILPDDSPYESIIRLED
jgi:predicted ATP-dependent endonuclease of OLD family